ncbi:MAG TPA: hypothetical protein QGF58_24580 [Myxococcota bacterium]|nr:hypothetical protein [Myxococcota bacterium]
MLADVLFHPLTLLAVPVLLWLLTPAQSSPDQVRPGREVALALCLGILVTLATAFWLWPLHTMGGPYTSNDFTNYCASVAAFGSPLDGLDQAGWHMTRSLTVGAIPSLLAGWFGTLDGLTVGAWIGCSLAVAGVYGWARSLASPAAGVAAAVLTGCLPSFVVMTHTVNFYPLMIALLVLSAAGAAIALRWSTTAALICGAAGAGAAFLADTRGLVWGLTATALVIVAALWAPRRLWPARLGIVVAALVASFALGRLAYPPGSYPLEGEVDARRLYWDLGHRDEIYEPPWVTEHQYVWGRSPPWEIPETLAFLWAQRDYPLPDHPPEAWGPLPVPTLSPTRLEPWFHLGLGGTAVATLLLLRRRRRLAALLCLAPFAASFLGARDTVEAHPRFVLTGTIAIAVLVGVGIAAGARLLDGLRPGLATRYLPPWAAPLRLLAIAAVCWLLVAGTLPSALSPHAEGRMLFQAEDQWHRAFFEGGEQLSQVTREVQACEELFAEEAARGLEPAGSLLSWARLRPRN